MSQEMKSQESLADDVIDDNESDVSNDDEDEEEDVGDYYNCGDGEEVGGDGDVGRDADPEYFAYELLHVEDAERLLNENVESVCQAVKVTPALAKVLLHTQKWLIDDIVARHRHDAPGLLRDSRIAPSLSTKPVGVGPTCPVCLQNYASGHAPVGLACGHLFCRDCWVLYLQHQIQAGLTTAIECMGKDCCLLVDEDFVMGLLSNPMLRDKYQEFSFSDHVKSHPELRFCPGPNCPVLVRATQLQAKRVLCNECKTTFCFRCGLDYHSPTDCETIKRWLTKCADDSETANYISAHTKDCPRCQVCIEKNGGCNHMQCSKCKHDFCWMCLGEWKTHGSQYYECSRYKENPNIANESVHAQAREALKKYIFYFERWENHSKSLRLEQQTRDKIKSRIEDKVMKSSGTWIDWQYLINAAQLLMKCRYTLQFTYPYAYYLEKSPRKQLFEYQQAQLEAEVENLSWKVERAEITDRGDLENQMDIAEKRRRTLIKDFHDR